MQVSNPNNIKIYNLSAGKSVPEWLTDRKKRSLQKSDVDLRRRIQLMQDFEMPTCSTCIRISKNKEFILATGVYKPRVRCYEVAQMSMKFERCMDSDVVNFLLLSDDYSKMVFLQNDRYVEFHSQNGRYYRTRLPKYGRDLAYHESSAELYFVGVGDEVYRFNLEQGRYMNPLKTNAQEINCCQFNPVHELFTCGTNEGVIECWDPRTRNRVGLLDCALNIVSDENTNGGVTNDVPGVTSLKYRDALNLAVGLSTGHVLLYDLRSSKPLLVKDHNYGLPIKDIEFHSSQDLVLSCDTKILKIWDRHTGAPLTSVEPPETTINGLCVFPNTGMMFIANEAPKILTYYIPALGPAPRWCSFLDSLTEELEENATPTVYDDYKFVTRTELEGLGLSDLIGTNLARAYMHGFFIDIRLYRKMKTFVEPFAYRDYRKKKIEEKRNVESRVQVKKLPSVNRQLAVKLLQQREEEIDQKDKKKKKSKKHSGHSNLLEDSRFSQLFSNADFQVDEQSEEYRLLNPLVSKLDRDRRKDLDSTETSALSARDSDQHMDVDSEREGGSSDDDDDESSSDDEHTWREEVKQEHKRIAQEKYMKEKLERQQQRAAFDESKKVKFYPVKTTIDEKNNSINSSASDKQQRKNAKKSLGERVEEEEDGGINESGSTYGNLEMSYKLKKSQSASRRDAENFRHREERRKLHRSTGPLRIPGQHPATGGFIPGRGRGGGMGRGRGRGGRGQGGGRGRGSRR